MNKLNQAPPLRIDIALTTAIATIVLAVALVACAGPTGGPSTGESTGTPTAIVHATATPGAEITEVPTPPQATATTTVEQVEPTATSEGAPSVTPGVPTPDPDTKNVFASVLGPVSTPEGWSVRPCAGDGPFLCVWTGQEHQGNVELSFFSLVTLPEFQGMLNSAGVVSATFDYRDPEQRTKAGIALRAFVDNYHGIFEEDRKTLYRDTARYNRLETREVEIGELPSITYGFSIVKQDETIAERWLLYSAYDGDNLYTIVAHYMPDSFGTFPSDAALQTFEPHFRRIAEGLQLPLRSVEAQVKQVKVLAETPLLTVPTEGLGPVALAKAGETLTVTGQSASRQWWRVPCPAGEARNCWVTADPKVTSR